MAKQAKSVDIEFTDKDVKKFVADIFERYERIESARGAFMRQARSERDGMVAVFEAMGARGLAQKVAKTEIAILRLIERIKKLTAELDVDQRRMLEKVARMQDDRKQLSLLLDAPKPVKVKAEKKPPKAKVSNVVAFESPETQPAA